MRVVYPASATHLGINRSTSQSVDIEGKMSLGRKTAYGWIPRGSGLKGVRNGHVDLCCTNYSKRNNFRAFWTISLVLLALLGIPPIESVTHKIYLSLICLQQ